MSGERRHFCDIQYAEVFLICTDAFSHHGRVFRLEHTSQFQAVTLHHMQSASLTSMRLEYERSSDLYLPLKLGVEYLI